MILCSDGLGMKIYIFVYPEPVSNVICSRIFFNTPCHFLSNAKPSFWVPPSITSKLVSRGFDLCELCQQQLFRFSPIYQTFIIIIKWVCVWRQTEGGYLLWVLNGEGVQVRALCMCVNNNINISWLFDQFVHICMYRHGKKMYCILQ